MSRRISVCVLSLVLAGAVLVPSSSFAQVSPGSRMEAGGLSWLSSLWQQVLDKVLPMSDSGGLIDGNGLAAQVGIQFNGTESDSGALIDGNGRANPANGVSDN